MCVEEVLPMSWFVPKRGQGPEKGSGVNGAKISTINDDFCPSFCASARLSFSVAASLVIGRI